jgi:isopentenyldiphosphate isomerase
MPDEIITLYLKEAPETPLPCNRVEYYDNDFTTYKEHHPALIDVFLFNTHGDVLLQKRARNKRNNPGKLHTTVGGHITWGDSAPFSVVHECLEELGAPALVFSKEEYASALNRLRPFTHKVALLYEEGVLFRNYANDPIESRRDLKDRMWLYFGLYDGPIETPDRTSAEYEWIDLDTLEKELQIHPTQFTDGLKIYMETFGSEMREFIRKFAVKQL